MRRKFKLLITLTLLNSCASIINSPIQKVNIDHDPGISVRIDTSYYKYREKEIYNVFIPKNYMNQNHYFLRCKSEIPLIINESDTFKIKPHRSYFAFWFANIYTSYGLGMLIDYHNDKSFEYPIFNYLAKVDNKIENIRFKPIPEKKFKFSLGIPSVNFFHLQTDSGKINLVSGLGISAEFNYFLKNSYYLSLNLGATLNLFSPSSDSISFQSHSGYYYFRGFGEYSSANFINLRFNKITPRFEYGIGPTLTRLKWSSNNLISRTDTTAFFNQSYIKSINLGLSTVFNYRFTPNFNVGLQYQPLFYDLSNNKYTYQSYLTYQLIWRF